MCRVESCQRLHTRLLRVRRPTAVMRIYSSASLSSASGDCMPLPPAPMLACMPLLPAPSPRAGAADSHATQRERRCRQAASRTCRRHLADALTCGARVTRLRAALALDATVSSSRLALRFEHTPLPHAQVTAVGAQLWLQLLATSETLRLEHGSSCCIGRRLHYGPRRDAQRHGVRIAQLGRAQSQ